MLESFNKNQSILKLLGILFLLLLPCKVRAIDEQARFVHQFSDGEKVLIKEDWQGQVFAKYSTTYGLALDFNVNPPKERIPYGTLNGNFTFCMDRGKAFGDIYTNTGQKPNATQLAAAGYFEQANDTVADLRPRIIAQLLVWQASDNNVEPDKIAEKVVNYYLSHMSLTGSNWPDSAKDGYKGEVERQVEDIIKGKYKAKKNYCIWQAGSSDQRMISECDSNPNPNPNICTNPLVSIKTCGNQSTFEDPKNWNCIKGDPKYQDLKISNRYCKVYCSESVKTNFPNQNNIFEAGRYFAIGRSKNGESSYGPVELSGDRTCKMYYDNNKQYIEGINYEQFKKDYENKAKSMADNYSKWKKEEARTGKGDKVVAMPNGCLVKEDTKDPSCPKNYALKNGMCTYNKSKITPTCEKGFSYDKTRMKCVQKTFGTLYTKLYSFNGTMNSDTYCNTQKPYDNSHKINYFNDKSEKDSLENAINTCKEMKLDYNFSPTMSLNYSNTSKYKYNGALSSTIYTNPNSKPIATYKTSGTGCDSSGNCSVANYECTNQSCKMVYKKFNNINVDTNTTLDSKVAAYNLPPNIYRYISKIDGNNYHTNSGLLSPNNYIDIGWSVLPIDITTNPGKYPIDLIYYNIGNIVGGKAHFDTYGNKSYKSINYSCEYKVKNSILCAIDGCKGSTANGLDLIYRPISLTVPFPGEDGLGRNAGSNWCSNGSCDTSNDIIQKNIIKNRGVVGDDVYNLKPMYSITLTPQIIKEIRKFNKSTNYGDFNLECVNGEKCQSDFIRNQVNGYNFSSYFNGTCSNASYANFMSCANK